MDWKIGLKPYQRYTTEKYYNKQYQCTKLLILFKLYWKFTYQMYLNFILFIHKKNIKTNVLRT